MSRTGVSLIFAGLMLVSACSPTPSEPQTSQGSVVDERSRKDLDLYRQMVEQEKFALAAPIGAGVLKRAPESAAADEIRQTLEDVQAKAQAINEKRRLAGLWLYQSGEQSGGRQNTATLHPTRPAEDHSRIRMILRRHSDWGESTYFYDTAEKGFVCDGKCDLPLKVDGEPAKPLVGSLPTTGDPALFIDSKERLLKLLETAETLTITIQLKDGGTHELFFEVGGFDSERWPQLSSVDAGDKPAS